MSSLANNESIHAYLLLASLLVLNSNKSPLFNFDFCKKRKRIFKCCLFDIRFRILSAIQLLTSARKSLYNDDMIVRAGDNDPLIGWRFSSITGPWKVRFFVTCRVLHVLFNLEKLTHQAGLLISTKQPYDALFCLPACSLRFGRSMRWILPLQALPSMF